MSESPYTYFGKRAGLLLAGFVLLLAGGVGAQQPTQADSVAVLNLAVERIIMLDSTRFAYDDSVQLRRVVDGPEAAWAAPALVLLRTLERLGEELEWLSVSAPQFKGDTALVYEHRRQCRVGHAAHGRLYEHRFVRTAERWAPLFSGGAIVDEVCVPGRRAP